MRLIPATDSDKQAVWGCKRWSQPHTAWVAKVNDTPAALFGFVHSVAFVPICYVDFNPSYRRNPKTVLTVARACVKELLTIEQPLHTIRNRGISNSDKFLSLLGFYPCGTLAGEELWKNDGH